MISIYFPTWSSPWVSDATKMDLALIPDNYPGVDCVSIAFAKPDMTYTFGSFDGTGLQFSQDFSVVVNAIKILKSKGVTVMLSVGGGSYWSTPTNTYTNIWLLLMKDLGCDGIDIDWEVGYSDRGVLTTVISNLAMSKNVLGFKISFAGFSTGAYGPDGGDTYKGMSIDAMNNAGDMVDWINIMTYDAGPSFDPLGALDCYRIYYKGPLNIGFEVGVQSWGGYLLTSGDVVRMATYAKKNDSRNGVFIWSLGKAGNPSVYDIVATCHSLFDSLSTPAQTTLPPTQAVNYDLTCKVCNTVYHK